jgi:hypothetical protein
MRPALSPSRRLRASRSSQRGLSLIGLIVLGVVLVFGALLGLKVFPTVTEFLAIQKAVATARGAPDPASIRAAFDRAAAIDDITSISGRDLQIARKPGGGFSVTFAYDKKIPIAGPASLLIEYRGDGSGPGAGK